MRRTHRIFFKFDKDYDLLHTIRGFVVSLVVCHSAIIGSHMHLYIVYIHFMDAAC